MHSFDKKTVVIETGSKESTSSVSQCFFLIQTFPFIGYKTTCVNEGLDG